jgi:hypothetical protein
MKRYFLVGAALVIALLALTAFVVSGQQAPAATIEVGSAVGGANAVEYIGRIDQDGSNFVSYGYLTHISGLTDTLLFSGTIPFVNESNAHFTFYTTATLTARNVITGAFNGITSSVFMIDAIGTTVYYYNATPSAAFANPDSFKAGVPVMTATVRSQNILNVQAPARGVGTNFAEFTQTGVSPFTLNGQPYQIGRVGILERLFSTGEGTNTDPITPKSFTLVAGNAVVTGVPGQQGFLPLVMHNAP